jgi:hypothetical protein
MVFETDALCYMSKPESQLKPLWRYMDLARFLGPDRSKGALLAAVARASE